MNATLEYLPAFEEPLFESVQFLILIPCGVQNSKPIPDTRPGVFPRSLHLSDSMKSTQCCRLFSFDEHLPIHTSDSFARITGQESGLCADIHIDHRRGRRRRRFGWNRRNRRNRRFLFTQANPQLPAHPGIFAKRPPQKFSALQLFSP